MGLFGNIGQALKYYATPDGLQAVGATLKDISAGGSENYQALQQAHAKRVQLEQQQAIGRKLAGLFGSSYNPQGMADAGGISQSASVGPSVESMVNGVMSGDPNAPTLDQVTARPATHVPSMADAAPILAQAIAAGYPGAGEFASLLHSAQPPKAPEDRFIEGPNGIYKIGSDGKPTMVQAYPTKPNTTPGQINPTTGRWEWAPGYLDSQVALTAGKAAVTRDAIVSRPMPRTGGHGKASQKKPWEMEF